MHRPGVSAWQQRAIAVAALLVVVVELGASAGAAWAKTKTTKPPQQTTPAFYVLKSAKQKCRANYTKQAITITLRKHHRSIHEHQTRCVYTGSRGAGGTTVSFPSGLPTAGITVTVIPTANEASYTIAANDTLVVGGAGVLTGNSDSGLIAQLVSGPAHGTLTLDRGGSFRYLPASSYSGVDSFTYKTVSSSGESSTPATVKIHVTPVAVAVGDYYVPVSSTVSVAAPGVLTGDAGTGLSAKLVSGPSGGSLTLDADGSFSYTASPSFSGADSFTFEAVDSAGQASNVVTVAINVGAQLPTVSTPTFSGAIANTELQVGGSRGSGPEVYLGGLSVLSDDSDPGGGTLSATPATIATADGGSVSLAADGSFSYQPPADFEGSSDSFTYEVNTSEGTSAQASATIDFDTGRIWYVDSSAAGAGDGSSNEPFESLATAVDDAQPGDVIFLFGGGTPYSSGETLASDVTLVGQPAGLSVDSEDLLDPSETAPAAQITGSGVGLTLADGDVVNAVTVEGTTSNGIEMGDGTFTIKNVDVSNAGGDGITATGYSNVTVTGSTIAGSGADGININDAADTVYLGFDLANNTITGSKDAAISLDSAGNANGTVEANTIGLGNTDTGTTTAGSGSTSGDGIDVQADGNSAWLYADVTENSIYGVAAGDGIDADASGGATLQLPLTFNAVYTDATSTHSGVMISAGETSSSDLGTVCVDPEGNTVSAGGTGTTAVEAQDLDPNNSFGIQGYTPTDPASSSGVSALLSTDNALSAPGGGVLAAATPSGGDFVACTVQQPAI